MHVKELVEQKIELCLSSVKISEGQRKAVRRAQRENELLEALRRQDLISGEEGEGRVVIEEDHLNKDGDEVSERSLLGQGEDDDVEQMDEDGVEWVEDASDAANSARREFREDSPAQRLVREDLEHSSTPKRAASATS